MKDMWDFFFSNDYFAEVPGGDFEYFKTERAARLWGGRRKYKIYKIPRGAEFHGVRGEVPGGNGVLIFERT